MTLTVDQTDIVYFLLETTEGFDKLLNLHYYSRMRFAFNLLPQLTQAAEPAASPASFPSWPLEWKTTYSLTISRSKKITVFEAA